MTWILQMERDRFQLWGTRLMEGPVEVTLPEDVTVGQAVRSLMEGHGYRGEPILLAISGWDCQAALVTGIDKRMARDRKALAYALERHLPISSEDFVADFVYHQGRALGIAIEIDRFQALVQDLAEQDVAIGSITPTVILWAEYLRRTKKLTANPTVLIVHRHNGWNLLLLQHGVPVRWHLVDAANLSGELARLTALLEDSQIWSSRRLELKIPYKLLGTTSDLERDVLLQSADAYLRHTQEPLIELRRDDLAPHDSFYPIRRQLRACLIATFVLTASVLTFLWVRIHHWETQTRIYDLQQRSLFTEVFPQRTIPVAVRPHLESELKRRQGLSGQQAMPTIGVTLDTVTRVLTALPGNLRFRIQSIRVDDKTIDLDGQARSHTDAEQIANAVRAAGIELDPLRSENLPEQGVTFSLHGIPVAPRLAEKRR